MLPSVTCVMLTRDRGALAAKAAACFLRQTYPHRRLLIYDSGDIITPIVHPMIAHAKASRMKGQPIGALRNAANELVTADIIAHWDDDDWSSAERLTEQVEFLTERNADAVGYTDMLFWDTREKNPETWFYSLPMPGKCLGTSLLYWRKTWEQKQFRNDYGRRLGTGEDTAWVEGLALKTHSSLRPGPRMVARIHGANNGRYNLREAVTAGSKEWRRDGRWDQVIPQLIGEVGDERPACENQSGPPVCDFA